MFRETTLRSVIKTISWRFCATLTTILIVYFFTKQIALSITVGGIEVILKLLVYYMHERVWNRVEFGRIYEELKTDGYTCAKCSEPKLKEVVN